MWSAFRWIVTSATVGQVEPESNDDAEDGEDEREELEKEHVASSVPGIVMITRCPVPTCC
jgi:hypothetical protein